MSWLRLRITIPDIAQLVVDVEQPDHPSMADPRELKVQVNTRPDSEEFGPNQAGIPSASISDISWLPLYEALADPSHEGGFTREVFE